MDMQWLDDANDEIAKCVHRAIAKGRESVSLKVSAEGVLTLMVWPANPFPSDDDPNCNSLGKAPTGKPLGEFVSGDEMITGDGVDAADVTMRLIEGLKSSMTT
jgi:hypothetical protein